MDYILCKRRCCSINQKPAQTVSAHRKGQVFHFEWKGKVEYAESAIEGAGACCDGCRCSISHHLPDLGGGLDLIPKSTPPGLKCSIPAAVFQLALSPQHSGSSAVNTRE